MPSLSSFFPTVNPAKPRSTSSAVMPLYPAAGSSVANTMNTSASLPFVIQSLRPFRTNPSASAMARVASANASLPDPASDSAYAPTTRDGELRQIAALHVVAAPARQRIHHQRVLDVDEDPHRRIDLRERLDREHGVEERSARAAVALGHLDAHHAEVEQLVDQRARERRVLVHLADERRDLAPRELEHAVPEQQLVLVEGGESAAGRGGRWIGHGSLDWVAGRVRVRW